MIMVESKSLEEAEGAGRMNDQFLPIIKPLNGSLVSCLIAGDENSRADATRRRESNHGRDWTVLSV